MRNLVADTVKREEDARFELSEYQALLVDLEAAARLLRPYHFPGTVAPHNEGDAAYRCLLEQVEAVRHQIESLQERWRL